jgi:hypothetical protein
VTSTTRPINQPRPSTRRRGRRWRTALIVLLVLAGLLVGADFALAAAAEYQVSQKMRAQLGLSDDPSVTIHGFPFVTQALAGDYSDITVEADGVPVKDTLRDLGVQADLRHVRVALSDLLSGTAKSVTIDEVDGRVKIRAADVGRLLDLPDLAIEPVGVTEVINDGKKPAKPQLTDSSTAGVQLSATVDIAGQKTKVTALALISLVHGQVQVTPKALKISNSAVSTEVPEPVRSQILGHFAVTLDPGVLPFQVTPTEVWSETGTLSVRGTARNVVLNGGGLGG